MTILTFYNNIGLKVSEGENNFFCIFEGGISKKSFLKKLEEGMYLRKHCTGLILENKRMRAV